MILNKFKFYFKRPAVFLLTCLMLLFSLSSCKDDDTPPSCGCESETVNTIPNENITNVPIEEQKKGVLFYKTSEKIDEYLKEEQFNNHFWVFQGSERCYNCQRNFIICNDEMVGVEFDYLKNTNDSISVKFTGELKYLCTDPFIAPGDYYYAEIKLNSIEQQ